MRVKNGTCQFKLSIDFLHNLSLRGFFAVSIFFLIQPQTLWGGVPFSAEPIPSRRVSQLETPGGSEMESLPGARKPAPGQTHLDEQCDHCGAAQIQVFPAGAQRGNLPSRTNDDNPRQWGRPRELGGNSETVPAILAAATRHQ